MSEKGLRVKAEGWGMRQNSAVATGWKKARVRTTRAEKERRSQATEGSGSRTFTVLGTMMSFSMIV
jgi:hypothetical protein